MAPNRKWVPLLVLGTGEYEDDWQAIESTARQHAIGRRIFNPADTDHNHAEEANNDF